MTSSSPAASAPGPGELWLQRAVGVEAFSPLGSRVAEILNTVAQGIYHLDLGALRRVEWANPDVLTFVWPVYELATWDFNELAGLVVVAHDSLVRLSIRPCTPKSLRLLFHLRRSRNGRTFARHPSIEDAVSMWRARADLRPEAERVGGVRASLAAARSQALAGGN